MGNQNIMMRSIFSDWREVTLEEATDYAKYKIKAICCGRNDEERLAIVNRYFKGKQFKLCEVS